MCAIKKACSGERLDCPYINRLPTITPPTIYLGYNAAARSGLHAHDGDYLLHAANDPSSVHRFGREAKKHLEDARKTIADAISAWPNEIIFTASGTEANATALRLDLRAAGISERHRAFLHFYAIPAQAGIHAPSTGASPDMDPGLRRDDIIAVDGNGVINLKTLDALLANAQPALVSVCLPTTKPASSSLSVKSRNCAKNMGRSCIPTPCRHSAKSPSISGHSVAI